MPGGQKTLHSRIVQVHVNDVCKKAVSLLSTRNKKGEIPLVLIPTPRWSFSFIMPVPSGVYCIVQRFGRDVGEMNPGLHVLPSWYRIAYVVSKQSTTYDAPVLSCPTSDDVRVSVDVVIVFHIFDASKFIYRLGAKNFDDFLSGTVDEAIRMLVRREDHNSVYSLRGERSDQMLKQLNDKFLESGVQFTDVKITSVWLPDELANCLETTTKLDKAMERLKRQNEFEMLQIRLESDMAIEEIRRKCEQVLVTESGRKRRAELEFEQRSVKAEEDGRVSLIEAEGSTEKNLLDVNAQLHRTKKELETYRVNELVKAQTAATEVKIKADHQQEAAVIEAAYQEQEMIYEAGCLKMDAGAEKDAQKLLGKKRRHDLDLREKQILADLGAKGQFNLVGTAGDKMIAAMMDGSFEKAKL